MRASLTSCRYDLRATFDIVVGQATAERFTVHTDILTARSTFLAAIRKPEWLAGVDASKPVDLSDEDPDVFQDYLNCVYLGPEALHEHIVEFERQISAHWVELYVCIRHQEQDEQSVAKIFEDFNGLRAFVSRKNGDPLLISTWFLTPPRTPAEHLSLFSSTGTNSLLAYLTPASKL